jgi:hypothetical protein
VMVPGVPRASPRSAEVADRLAMPACRHVRR